jgi:hypothetical protein
MIMKTSFLFIALIVPGGDRSLVWLEIVARRIEGSKMERPYRPNWSQSRQYPRMLHCQTRNQMRKSMCNPDPHPEIAPRFLLEAYERGYQANHGYVHMQDAAGEELHRKTICHAGYPDEPRAAFEEALVEVPGFIHRVVTHTSGAGDIGSQITEGQLLADRRQVEKTGVPPGLVITLDGPVPILVQVDAGIPPRQRQAMEAASWEEE